MVVCSACGASNDPGLPFHRFPVDVQRCNEWAMLIRRYDLLDLAPGLCNQNYWLCGAHFDGDELSDGAAPLAFGHVAASSFQSSDGRDPALEVAKPFCAYDEAKSLEVTMFAEAEHDRREATSTPDPASANESFAAQAAIKVTDNSADIVEVAGSKSADARAEAIENNDEGVVALAEAAIARVEAAIARAEKDERNSMYGSSKTAQLRRLIKEAREKTKAIVASKAIDVAESAAADFFNYLRNSPLRTASVASAEAFVAERLAFAHLMVTSKDPEVYRALDAVMRAHIVILAVARTAENFLASQFEMLVQEPKKPKKSLSVVHYEDAVL